MGIVNNRNKICDVQISLALNNVVCMGAVNNSNNIWHVLICIVYNNKQVYKSPWDPVDHT